MPVFSRFRDNVLVLTVDGDYTANELQRVASAAFESDEITPRVPIILDMSGAAGLELLGPDELKASGAVFGAHRERIAAIGVVAAAGAHELFSQSGGFTEQAGVPVQACRSHVEARSWLDRR